MDSTAVNMSGYTGPSAFSSVAPPSTPTFGTPQKKIRMPLKKALELIQLSKNRKKDPAPIDPAPIAPAPIAITPGFSPESIFDTNNALGRTPEQHTTIEQKLRDSGNPIHPYSNIFSENDYKIANSVPTPTPPALHKTPPPFPRNRRPLPDTQEYNANISPVIPDQIVITTKAGITKRGVFTIKKTDKHTYSIAHLKYSKYEFYDSLMKVINKMPTQLLSVISQIGDHKSTLLDYISLYDKKLNDIIPITESPEITELRQELGRTYIILKQDEYIPTLNKLKKLITIPVDETDRKKYICIEINKLYEGINNFINALISYTTLYKKYNNASFSNLYVGKINRYCIKELENLYTIRDKVSEMFKITKCTKNVRSTQKRLPTK